MPIIKKTKKEKKMEKRQSRILRKVGSMDGILIDKFGYECILRVDATKRYMFEIL